MYCMCNGDPTSWELTNGVLACPYAWTCPLWRTVHWSEAPRRCAQLRSKGGIKANLHAFWTSALDWCEAGHDADHLNKTASSPARMCVANWIQIILEHCVFYYDPYNVEYRPLPPVDYKICQRFAFNIIAFFCWNCFCKALWNIFDTS